jgi:hypothetical protein
MYRLTFGGSVQQKSDGAFIPVDPANVDYRGYLAWIAAGNNPDPAEPPPLPPYVPPSPREWLERLPLDRQAGIVDAAFGAGGIMRLWIIKATAATFIETGSPETQLGIQALLGAGLLTQAEANLLSAP